MSDERSSSFDVRWLRLAEGALAMGLLVVLFVVVVGPSRVADVLRKTHPWMAAVTFTAAVVWLVAWGETMYQLFAIHWSQLDDVRFRVAYLGGMGVRGLVPGGSVSGPAVVAYVLTTSTDAETEGGVAMAYLAEVLYWLASIVVVGVGFVAIMILGTPPGKVYTTAAIVGAVLAIVLLGGLVVARRPALVEGSVRRIAAFLRGALGGHFPRLGDALSPEAVDRRLERFREAFRRLAEDPRHLVPALGASLAGWLANVFVLTSALASLGVAPPPYVAMFAVPVAGFARTVSLLPGGIGGVAPTMTALLVALSDVTLPAAGAAVLLYRLATFWFRLGIGGVCLVALGLVDLSARERVPADVG